MTISANVKLPVWFWVLSVLALLWNLMGVFAYLAEAYMTDEAFATLPEAQQALYETRPSWVTGAFAIAVFAGTLASIGLLLRKKWAFSIFVLSLLGVLGQMTYQFFLSNTFEVMGNQFMVMPIAIILLAIALVLFSRSSIKKAWLR